MVEDEFAPYIPPQSQRPRSPRMPRVDELPLPAQNQIRAQRGEPPVEQPQPDKKRMTLLQCLAHVGRREEEPEPARRDQPSMRAPERRPDPRAEGRDVRPTLPGRGGEPPVSEFAKRPPMRPAAEVPSRPGPHAHEDDQLEIPAFLRRQAN